MDKVLYKNKARDEELDRELEELEEQYKRENDPEYKAQKEKEDDPVEGPAPVDEKDAGWQKRYSNLRSFSAKKENELLKRIETLEIKLKEKESSSLPKDEEDLEVWIEKYPDIARIVSTLIGKKTGELKDDISKTREELKIERENLLFEKAYAQIVKAHPDFEALIRTEEYSEWLEKQPREKGLVGQAYYDALVINRTDPVSAINAFNIFKQERKKNPAAQRERDTAAARTVAKHMTSSVPERTDGKKVWKESEIEKMNIRLFDRYEQEIEEARLDGRIEYDISGAAR